ncbi:MATE family efflux transporter [Mycoplasma struthionis]|uniref:MATE family efflux transporter n=1 Tax=Mycoplasma struthionis TaxID=538220 RepID=A0A502M2J5_9MOLU|nr:MATE family efflux transporter [Mycoplasma struthionis]
MKVQINKNKHVFRRLLPQNKSDWKSYFIKTLPIIIGEILFCLNGFLDNFMVSHISGGVDALSYANSYTGIIYTVFFSIQGIAAMFVGQYYGKKDYDKVKQIINLRFWLNFVVVICFAIPTWVVGKQMIELIGGPNIKESVKIQSVRYLSLICISWLLTTYNINTNMLLNETGHSKYAFFSACATMTSNALINVLFLYILKKPAYYAAIGSIIGALVCAISDELWTYFKDRKIFINPLKVFYITKPIAKQILSKIPAMLITISAMITIPLRLIIWTRAYPDDLLHGSGVGSKWMGINSANVFGLVESLSTIASAVTGACSSNVSFFVAAKLGHNEFDEAEKHSHALKGFHALLGFIVSILLLAVVFAIAYSPTTTNGISEGINKIFYENKQSSLANQKQYVLEILKTQNRLDLLNYINQNNSLPFLNQNPDYDLWVKKAANLGRQEYRKAFLFCSFTFLAFNPVWCWFYTSAALPRAGGRTIIASITMWVAQWLSFIWLVILTFAIVLPLRANGTNISIALTYFLFYSIDFIRLAIFEIVAWKTDWKRNITINHKSDSEPISQSA